MYELKSHKKGVDLAFLPLLNNPMIWEKHWY